MGREIACREQSRIDRRPFPASFPSSIHDIAQISFLPCLLVLTVLLHAREELDDDLGGRSDEHLTLALSLSVDDGLQTVVLRGEGGDSRVDDMVSKASSSMTLEPPAPLLTRTEMRTTARGGVKEVQGAVWSVPLAQPSSTPWLREVLTIDGCIEKLLGKKIYKTGQVQQSIRVSSLFYPANQ